MMMIGFGLAIPYQIWVTVTRKPIVFSNRLFLWSIMMELITLAIVLWIARVRRWPIITLEPRINWRNTLGGILLFLVTTVAMILVELPLLYLIGSQKSLVTVNGITLPFIILLSIINPIFEEILEAGYFVHALERFGMWPTVLASGLLRGILHMYQGIGGVIALFTFGAIFALVYWRWRQLWPLIIAHSLNDFVGLLFLAHRG